MPNMKLIMEGWRQYLNEQKKEGGGMLLYHATCFPPESFAKGIDASRAKGYGQGAGFYFWTKKENAISHAKKTILKDVQKEENCPEEATTAYIVISDEPVTPETFDIDYEVYAQGFAKFMINNLKYFFNNMETFGMTPPRVSSRMSPADYVMKPPHQFKVPVDDSGTIKLYYLAQGSDTDTYKAASLSKIANKLAEIDPPLFKEFEEQFLFQASAVKYNGEKVIYPLRIEDLEGNVVWSRG